MNLLPLTTALCLLIPLAHAQERTAGGNLQNEASWSALKTLVENAQGTARTAQITANSALDKATKMENCGDQKKIYDKSENACIPIAPSCVLQGVQATARDERRIYCGISYLSNAPNIQDYQVYIPLTEMQANNSSETSFSQRGVCLRVVCK